MVLADESELRSTDERGLADEGSVSEGPRPYVARSLWLSSEALGLTAKIDVVEGSEDGSVIPIEYKRGKAPEVPEGAYLPERAQLGAQVLLLREHGYICNAADIYFAGSKKRISIGIDDTLLTTVRDAVRRVRVLCSRTELPPPLEDSPKCDGCSLIGICLPDETNLLRKERSRADDAAPSALRRLHPARDDRLPLYVTEPGARIGVDGSELVVRGKEQTTRARLPNTSHVSLFGNVQISTQALRRLMEQGISVTFLSSGGWFYGRAEGIGSNNVDLRMAQHRAAADPATCLQLARAFVEAKIRNSRTMLRRNHDGIAQSVLFELEQLARKAAESERIESLLGLEGTAARVYFGAFSGMLRGEAARTFDLDGRNRRPPKDPVNALLSLAYATLARELTVALGNAGLDPLLGFYHRPRFGRPALALDMMEELRPVIADSVVLTALNTGVVGESDFLRHPVGVSLTPAARKRLLLAHERRMDQIVTHPVFGYQVSWRRMLEVQARLLGRFLLGEIPTYPQLRPR
ncbi:CRISPR-associated endonuclease Cas1 [Pendulispora albinea]|uniref:CRISPR-associated endonuclease Cas1 n=1 Tax=Pendulispora albinea TaxID=2741071 RepID=A0ABZ2MCC8_9BACT